MSDKNLYICHVYFSLRPGTPKAYLVTPVIASDDADAVHEARADFKQMYEGTEARYIEASAAPVDRSFVERAAGEVLGWKGPDE